MNLALETIFDNLKKAATDDRVFPPTLLFEEGWMMRLVLSWFHSQKPPGYELSFDSDARWYSEARLASTFLARYRGDKHAEGYTHADGVIGHFNIGDTGQADLSLAPDAKIFQVVEAKMFSHLSPGTTHARNYNQAARNVACMAELLRLTDQKPSDIGSLSFSVMAPKEQIDQGIFVRQMTYSSIEETVGDRVKNYDEPKSDWFDNWFMPTLESIRIKCISWEDIIEFITASDQSFGNDLSEFYVECLKYNRPKGGNR